MTEELHPGLGSGALREALAGLVVELQASADRTYAPGGPGYEEFEKGLCTAYLIAAGSVQKLLSLSSPIEPPATITPQMMSGVFAKSVSNTDTEHDHVYDHRIAAAEINKLLARPTSQASSEIREAPLLNADDLEAALKDYDAGHVTRTIVLMRINQAIVDALAAGSLRAESKPSFTRVL